MVVALAIFGCGTLFGMAIVLSVVWIKETSNGSE